MSSATSRTGFPASSQDFTEEPEAGGFLSRSCEWSVTVIARNEAANIGACLHSVAEAISGRDAIVTVIVNGSTDRTKEEAGASARRLQLPSEIRLIAVGDKSNAWNQFVHHMRPEARQYFFVDGHVTIAPDALRKLSSHLDANQELNVVSGTPLGSPSAKAWREALLTQGGVVGCLHVLSSRFMEIVQSQGFRLPTGLYRGDGLLHSFAVHDGDAIGNPRRMSLTAQLGDANFSPCHRSHEVRRHLARRVRQGRGRLENAAIKSIIYIGNYAALPDFAATMIRDWVAADESRFPRLMKDPWAYAGWRALQHETMPEPAALRAAFVQKVLL